MKYFYNVGIALTLAVSVMCLSIPGKAMAAENKIGTISLQDVLSKSKVGQQAQQDLESKVQEFQDKFAPEQKELEDLASDIEKKRSVWSQDVLAEKERSYQRLMREYKLKTDDAQYELKELEKKVMEPILKDLHDIIAEYGKKENFVIILENTRKGLSSRIGLLYASDEIDISEAVLKLLDEKQPK
jgi:outer membrane protein